MLLDIRRHMNSQR